MTNEAKELIAHVIVFAFIIILGFGTLTIIESGGVEKGRHQVGVEAIERGYAEWVTNEDGEAEWRWKSEGEKK